MTIAVEPKFRGKGVGAALMKACFEDLLMTPSKRMILEVAADNPAAIKLYNKLGFHEDLRAQGVLRAARWPAGDGAGDGPQSGVAFHNAEARPYRELSRSDASKRACA